MATTSRPAPRTNRERTEESTLRLLGAAIELFAEKGYERTTAAEIGLRAGFSRNMVRDRYGSKEALLQSLFETFGQRLLPAVRRERTGDGLAQVMSQLDDLRYSIRKEPEMMRAMIVLTFEAPGPLSKFAPWLEGLIAGYQRELADHLAVGQHDGSIRRDLDPAREAEVFVSYAIGLCFRSALLREAYDFPGEVDAWRSRLADHLRAAPQ